MDNDINNELLASMKMFNYLTTNLIKLPPVLQDEILNSVLRFTNQLKPLYVVATVLLDDNVNEKDDIEE